MELNLRQREAVDAPKGPLLILAGAGSGKTKTLTARVAKLLERGEAPESIVAITFTNKAALEMKERVEKLRNNRIGTSFIGTFHSFGAKILREQAQVLGRTARFTIMDDDDSARLIRTILKGNPGRRPITPAKLGGLFGKVKAKLLEPSEFLEDDTRIMFEAYETGLKEMNAFDFDDLLEKVVRLFERHPAILKSYRERFRSVLVDEYQDVNAAQYELVRLLAQEHKNISVVGDDAQAIYGWRHADYRSFLRFLSDFPDARVVKLEQCYRSTDTIVKAASALISENKLQTPKELWTENAGGEPIGITAAGDQEEEATWIADEIFEDKHPETTAILYRTNAQSRAIEQALITSEIPYRIYGGVRFYERAEVKDIVAAIRVVANPKDTVAADRITANLPARSGRSALTALREVSSNLPPLEIINIFLTSGSYLDFIRRSYPNAEDRILNIKELVAYASGFTDSAEFLERVTLAQATDDDRKKPAKVNLMSIHMAKGLEFDRVFIAGVTEGLLPHQMSYRTKEEIEEERRLLYVAMTRARKNLALSFAGLPSRFLSEIPPELTTFKNLSGGQTRLPEDDIIYLD